MDRNYAKLAESQSKRQLIQCASMDRQTEGKGGTGEWQTDTATNGNENGGKWENKGRRIAKRNRAEQNSSSAEIVE